MSEIISPGWSYQKAMFAAKYGADAVYVWVPFLSLRMRQNKIKDFQTLKKTIKDLQSMWKKAYLTINIFPRNTDLKVIEATIEQISDLWADSVIFSDPWVFMILKKYLKWTKYHLSTQTNTLDSLAVKFWADQWVDRVVLARELSIKEIAEIKKAVPYVELEAFVHWAMCMTYSWRCLLWEYFSWRDWNKWECSHVCRYKFNVYLEEEKRPWKFFKVDEDETWSFLLSSKDLCTIEHGQELFDHIDAWKIEWRSKSEFYVWAVTKAYSHLRDSIESWQKPNEDILNLVYDIPHRDYRDWFLFNNIRSAPDAEDWKSLVKTITWHKAWPSQDRFYIWSTSDESISKDWKCFYKIQAKDNINIKDEFDVLNSSWNWHSTKIDWILDENWKAIQRAHCNMKFVYIYWDWLEERNILTRK